MKTILEIRERFQQRISFVPNCKQKTEWDPDDSFMSKIGKNLGFGGDEEQH